MQEQAAKATTKRTRAEDVGVKVTERKAEATELLERSDELLEELDEVIDEAEVSFEETNVEEGLTDDEIESLDGLLDDLMKQFMEEFGDQIGLVGFVAVNPCETCPCGFSMGDCIKRNGPPGGVVIGPF